MKPIINHNFNFFDAEKEAAYNINSLAEYRRLLKLAEQNPKHHDMISGFHDIIKLNEDFFKKHYIGDQQAPRPELPISYLN